MSYAGLEYLPISKQIAHSTLLHVYLCDVLSDILSRWWVSSRLSVHELLYLLYYLLVFWGRAV